MNIDHIYHGDNIEVIKTFPDNSVDAIITDSPYGLGKEPDITKCLLDWLATGHHDIQGSGFMGKKWDAFVPQPVLWRECFRVLKPGGHLLSFFGTRTYDLGTMAIRLAGFELRDCIMWVYGSGFPKSLDVSKGIDKKLGAERVVTGVLRTKDFSHHKGSMMGKETTENDKTQSRSIQLTEASSDEAKKYTGYGTALKPACEPICVARKPLDGTVVDTVLKWGTGGISIDEGRISTTDVIPNAVNQNIKGGAYKSDNVDRERDTIYQQNSLGRWPSNVMLDEETAADMDLQSGVLKSGKMQAVKRANVKGWAGDMPETTDYECEASTGGASRFFYVAKASTAERAGRKHPTIKPIKLMTQLVRLYCPSGGIVLDPHIGSGTTALACIQTGRRFIGIDTDEESVKEAIQITDEHYI